MILAEIYPQSVKNILTLPSSYDAGDIMVGTADTSGNYYLLAKYESETYAVVTISLLTGQILRKFVLNAATMTGVFPQSAYFDPQSKNVIGGGISFEKSGLVYYYVEINPMTGAVTKQVLAIAAGIVTSWTFDAIGRVLYFAEAVSSGAYIYSFDLASKSLGTPVLLPDIVPESLEWSVL